MMKYSYLMKSIAALTICSSLTACGPQTKTAEKNTEEHTEHHHHMTTDEKKIYDGYFEDHMVKDRALTDWKGDWQSVYPYLKDGTLDKVFEHKADEDESMTAEEYKAYYKTGYKTDVSRINIGEEQIDFYKGEQHYSGRYEYDGKEILNYDKGNRGVRFTFKKTSGDQKAPMYIQFSDHNIATKRASHFHIYMGNDRAALLKELEHWPTYYFSDMSGEEISHEMMEH